MNKYKLSPQEYKQILSKIELESITLVETRSKYSENSFDDNIDISIKETSKNAIDQNLLKIYPTCTFLVKRKGTDEEVIKLMVRYRLDFKFDVEPEILNDEFIKILTDNT